MLSRNNTSPTESDAIDSLFSEGWAMLSCLVSGLDDSPFEPLFLVDESLLSQLPNQSDVRWVKSALPLGRYGELPHDTQSLIAIWKAFVEEADAAIVIAPEIDGTLESCIRECAAATQLINCSGDALRFGANKLAMYEQLTSAHRAEKPISTVPTVSLDDTNAQVLCDLIAKVNAHHAGAAKGSRSSPWWVVKPSQGAGCDKIRCFDHTNLDGLAKTLHQCQESMGPQTIVQPWIDGATYSTHAIVDQGGVWHWLPLTHQEISIEQQGQSELGDQVHYVASHVVRPDELSMSGMEGLCKLRTQIEKEFADGALGWISFDLVLTRADEWLLIECNPRLTTSILELTNQYAGNLPAELVSLALGMRSSFEWR